MHNDKEYCGVVNALKVKLGPRTLLGMHCEYSRVYRRHAADEHPSWPSLERGIVACASERHKS